MYGVGLGQHCYRLQHSETVLEMNRASRPSRVHSKADPQQTCNPTRHPHDESSPPDVAGGGDGSADESDYGELDSGSSREDSNFMLVTQHIHHTYLDLSWTAICRMWVHRRGSSWPEFCNTTLSSSSRGRGRGRNKRRGSGGSGHSCITSSSRSTSNSSRGCASAISVAGTIDFVI